MQGGQKTHTICCCEAECKALQLNSFNHPFASSMETDRRIDRLSVCKGALFSAHSSITSALPGSSIYWWLEKDEWTWRILTERCIECVCLLPLCPEIIMWVLLFKEQLRLLQNCMSVQCLSESDKRLWLCWTNNVWERSISAAQSILVAFLSDKLHVPLPSVYFVFYFFSLVPSQSLHLPFLLSLPCLFLYTIPPPPPPPPPPCSTAVCSDWMNLISNHLTLSELVIPLAISTRLRREKKGGQGAFRRSCTHCKEGAVGITLQARPRQTGGLPG